ncbi:hypothetical protein [Sphingomonas sp.]|uniref:hypothetical protein n=1 Tax=Sphingomonas sp. TaxID=28214 RepID=UPI00257F0923|nr:hypothetical protein [Sphingomonas sp.]
MTGNGANKTLEAKLTRIDGRIDTMRSSMTIWFGVTTTLLALLCAAVIWSA